MSEHMHLRGRMTYDHLPFDEKGGLTWCPHCKKTAEKVEISLHNGIESDWMAMLCCHCNKVIWTSKIDMREEKLNKKCAICKMSTSDYNAMCIRWTGPGAPAYYCSRKCYRKESR